MLSSLLTAASVALVATASPLSLRAVPASTDNVTLAVVQAAPINWPAPLLNKNWTGVSLDINATTLYGIQLIEEAANNGANLIAFPETWFPGYPKGNDDAWIRDHAESFIGNSLVVGDSNWLSLLAAAKNNSVYLGLGFSERDGDYIYMAQALISPEGEVLIHRHKLRPSGGERSIWSDGNISQLKVVSTPIGRIGMLECWEHSHPAMTFNVLAQAEDIHIGAWPYTPDYNNSDSLWFESAEVNNAFATTYVASGGAVFVQPTIGFASIYSGGKVFSSSGQDSQIYETVPIIYTSVNATAFANQTSTPDGEQSWNILQEINAGFVAQNISKANGTFTTRKMTSIASLQALSSNATIAALGNASLATASAAAPASASATASGVVALSTSDGPVSSSVARGLWLVAGSAAVAALL
ncbi:carbon-nitrogen hydrolase [Mrakia frigida]|uniref:carbon-nitrogen hydrolase n=1 Tax=Mrakia frigida TaxID=29902 RepID=UPI003FCC1F40